MPQRESLAMIKLQVLLGLSWRSIIIHASTGPDRLPLPQKSMIRTRRPAYVPGCGSARQARALRGRSGAVYWGPDSTLHPWDGRDLEEGEGRAAASATALPRGGGLVRVAVQTLFPMLSRDPAGSRTSATPLQNGPSAACSLMRLGDDGG